MNAVELLETLRATGSTIEVRGQALVIEAPAGAINEQLKGLLREYKPDLIALLSAERPKPFIDGNGTLHTPLASDPRYHWWNGGQTVEQTLLELDAPPDVMRRYVEYWSP